MKVGIKSPRWNFNRANIHPKWEWIWSKLAGIYLFTEGSGDRLFDYSGGNSVGSITNASWDRGEVGLGLKFDGSGDFVDLGDSQNLKIDLPLTLFCMFERNGGQNWGFLISTDSFLPQYNGANMQLSTSEAVACNFGDGGNPDSATKKPLFLPQ